MIQITLTIQTKGWAVGTGPLRTKKKFGKGKAQRERMGNTLKTTGTTMKL